MAENDSSAAFGELLAKLIADSEEALMARILHYAKARDYARYTSTLQEAWRLSIAGLSAALMDALVGRDEALELGPDIDFAQDPVAAFGIREARRHRERGVDLGMFLGLMKYYRQAYADTIRESSLPPDAKAWAEHRMRRFFDRVEIGFCVTWAEEGASDGLQTLRIANRRMTNEKNKYLTFFESMPHPAFMVDRTGAVENMNQAAARLFGEASVPGGHYYRKSSEFSAKDTATDEKVSVDQLLPWIRKDFDDFMAGSEQSRQENREIPSAQGQRQVHLRFSKMLDVSGKFTGAVIIVEDITERKAAEEERLKREKLEGTLELAGAVCHELNQPIMAVSGYSELTMMSLDPEHDLYGKIKKINDQVLRMGEITRKLMKITRYRSKRYSKGERIVDIEGSSHET